MTLGSFQNGVRAPPSKGQRDVAAKVLSPELHSTAFVDRFFFREIRFAAGLAHPNILPLHDSGAADGQLFYVPLSQLFYVTPISEGRACARDWIANGDSPNHCSRIRQRDR